MERSLVEVVLFRSLASQQFAGKSGKKEEEQDQQHPFSSL